MLNIVFDIIFIGFAVFIISIMGLGIYAVHKWDYKNKEVEIIFRNGYRKDSPTVKCKCKLRIGQGKPEWGAEPNKEYYILDILSVEE